MYQLMFYVTVDSAVFPIVVNFDLKQCPREPIN